MIELRPVRPKDAEFLRLLDEPQAAGEFNVFERAAGDDGPHVAGEVGRSVVWLGDATPVGSVSWFAVPYGPNNPSVAWRIGITIHPDHRRRGYGSRAQRLLAEQLLATTAANRVEADTDVENLAEQRALERAGFRREGVARGAQFRGGVYHDVVVYGLTVADL